MKAPIKNILLFGWPVAMAGLIFLFYSLSQGGDNSAGAKLYKVHCANCHMEEGQGLRGLYPPLSAADYLANSGPELACLIRNGFEGEMLVNGKRYKQPMPANENLTEQEIAILINYIRTSWENKLAEIPYQDVKNALEGCSTTENGS